MNDVLAEERRRQIVQRIRADGAVRVAELAANLSVAEETVRRDLKLLDEQGVLTRTHGGALALAKPADQSFDEPFEHRRKAMLPQKQAIAREALARISQRAADHGNGPATIALDGSTTAWQLATLLTDPTLTVVTNSLMITTLLAGRPGPRVVCVGGSLDRDLMMFTGMIALDGLRHMIVDLFFCSCAGVHPQRGFSDPSEAGAHFKQQLIAVADQTIVLADSSKFHARSPVVFASPGEVNELITDAAADAAVVGELEATGLRCTRVN